MRAAAVAWYRRHWRPVTIVIPSYRDAEQIETLVASIRETTNEKRVRIVVADDASGADIRRRCATSQASRSSRESPTPASPRTSTAVSAPPRLPTTS